MSKEDYAKIAPHLGQVKCITASAKTDRGYPNEIAAHLLGYIRRIDQQQFEKTKQSGDDFYSNNDFIGITGLEKVYESTLGEKEGM